MDTSQKTYYVYVSFDKDDNFYIGSSSCVGDPEKHNYYGSGKAIQSGEFVPVRKRIINTYDSRYLAGVAEKKLIELADPKNNPVCFNRYCQGANNTEEAHKRMSEARKGKAHSAETKAKISEALSGENRPMFGKSLSKAHKAKMSQALSGENNPRFDNSLHKFVNIDGREVVGIYKDLCQNAKQLLGFSATSLHRLKMGYRQSVNGWQYHGVTGNG